MSFKPLVIAGRTFGSRLILGTGKFPSPEAMRDALAASGTEMVTVALRRADLSGKKDPFANILEFIDPKKYLLLPNTSGAMNAEEAVRLARLAVAAGLPKWVKLEIHPDPRYLLPDPIETFKAAEILVKEGFTVLPYINADPVLAKRLQEVGCATVTISVPLAASASRMASGEGNFPVPRIRREPNVRPAMTKGLNDIRDNLENCGELSRREENYSMSLNQSLTLNLKRSASSSAKTVQWAIGPLKPFKLFITFSTAFMLLKIDPNTFQLLLMISANSPKVVKSSGSSDLIVMPESRSLSIRF